MSRKSKREIERAVEDLAGGGSDVDEWHFGGGVSLGTSPAPELSEALATQGFIVERDLTQDVVMVSTTPSVGDVYLPALWHWDGPTVPVEMLRVEWTDDAARDETVATAEHQVITPAMDPDVVDPVEIATGDGWRAVAPREQTIETLVDRRDAAERYDAELLGAMELPITDAETYDLVRIDAPPAPYSERRALYETQTPVEGAQ